MAESECNGRCSSVSEEEIVTLLCDKDSVKTNRVTKVSSSAVLARKRADNRLHFAHVVKLLVYSALAQACPHRPYMTLRSKQHSSMHNALVARLYPAEYRASIRTNVIIICRFSEVLYHSAKA